MSYGNRALQDLGANTADWPSAGLTCYSSSDNTGCSFSLDHDYSIYSSQSLQQELTLSDADFPNYRNNQWWGTP
jgi:hypothetical protein